VPIITVELFKGRTREQKRELVQALTETYVRVLGGRPDAVTIVLSDVAKEDWAVAGELMADKYPD
jgi:4-oxalocrotonate tautomerase